MPARLIARLVAWVHHLTQPRLLVRIAEAAAAAPVLDNVTEVHGRTDGAVREAAVRPDGTVPIRIISPGTGSSGYYPPEVLEQAAADGVFPAGTHMYIDHPGATESVDRPERSLRDLAGVLATPARWDPNHPDGPGLYAEARIYQPWQPLINEMAADIGVSIRASAQVRHGERPDGTTGPIIERIVAGRSVDFVTQAGRGGRILELLEAARTEVGEARSWLGWLESRIHLDFTQRADDAYGDGRLTKEERIALSGGIGAALDAFSAHVQQTAPGLLTRDLWDEPSPAAPNPVSESEEDIMTPEQINEAVAQAVQAQVAPLQEAIETLTAERDEARTETARLREAQLVRDGRDAITAQVNAVEGLPAPTRTRLIGQLAVADRIPVTEAGALDTEALTAQVAEAVQAELAYLAEATGSPVRDAGDSTGGQEPEKAKERLTGAFMRLGLSESAAKVAAEGRVA